MNALLRKYFQSLALVVFVASQNICRIYTLTLMVILRFLEALCIDFLHILSITSLHVFSGNNKMQRRFKQQVIALFRQQILEILLPTGFMNNYLFTNGFDFWIDELSHFCLVNHVCFRIQLNDLLILSMTMNKCGDWELLSFKSIIRMELNPIDHSFILRFIF